MFYEKILRTLIEKEVRFAVTGGLALVMHGVVRFTSDLDLIIDLNHNNLKNFISVIEKLNFKPRVPIAINELLDEQKRSIWINEKNMIAFTLYNPNREIEEIDIFIKEFIPFDEIQKDIKWMRVKDLNIPVISIHHLKILKSLSSRPQDIADIKALEQIERLKDD